MPADRGQKPGEAGAFAFPFLPWGDLPQQAIAYGIDAWQRQLLYLDLLRQRGNLYDAQQARSAPDVLHFEAEVLIDGRDLSAPVNYRLMRILPPKGATTDPCKRPFIVFDPRAGQGPGIGGMKKDSEIGIALSQGHPVYFVGFLPEPVPGQTVEHVCEAEAHFVRAVIERHPDADKPCLIGNCQAGWQIALMSSLHAELPGVLILAGAPLSYWEGARGQGPMRYAAGLVGGSWINAMLSDLGGGFFDGAWLVQSFEASNPANTLWKKPYRVYAKVDTEGPRFLAFERWWGSPVLLDAREIQFISDELFIGNHLTQGKIHTSSGYRADLRNIRSPIVVFCSQGDDITPPQQALGWILDLYACDDDIVAGEQTIVYSMHEHVGHLGIFVSSAFAAKEHFKFISNIDIVETLPPGLYEARLVSKNEDPKNAALASGEYILQFEKRSLADIRALGGNSEEDDRRFETVARLSENLQGLYNTFLSPFIKAMVTRESAEALRQWHPLRLAFSLFSDKNPLLSGLPFWAALAQENRQTVSPGNLFWQAQEALSGQMVALLESLSEARGAFVETLFMELYGSPFLQASLGLLTARPYAKPKPELDPQLEKERHRRLLKLLGQTEEGGLAEAMMRGLLYIGHGEKLIDEREIRMLALLQTETQLFPKLSQEDARSLARQQYMMLRLDEERALRAIPTLLDRAPGQAKEAFSVLRRVAESSSALTPEGRARLSRLETLFTPAGTKPRRRAGDR